jgi:hypothetical protein
LAQPGRHFGKRRPLKASRTEKNEQDAQRIDVGARVGLPISVLLRRRSRGRAHEHGVLDRQGVELARDIKVDQKYGPVRRDNDVLRLDVPVDDRRPARMKIGQQIAKLDKDADGLAFRRHAARRDPLMKGNAPYVGTDEIGKAFFLK